MTNNHILCYLLILVAVVVCEKSEIVDLQPAGTFGFGLGLGGGGLGWNRRAFIPKNYGWDSGYIPAYIDGDQGHYPAFGGYEEVPVVQSYGWGWGNPVYPPYGGIVDNGLGWGWNGQF